MNTKDNEDHVSERLHEDATERRAERDEDLVLEDEINRRIAEALTHDNEETEPPATD